MLKKLLIGTAFSVIVASQMHAVDVQDVPAEQAETVQKLTPAQQEALVALLAEQAQGNAAQAASLGEQLKNAEEMAAEEKTRSKRILVATLIGLGVVATVAVAIAAWVYRDAIENTISDWLKPAQPANGSDAPSADDAETEEDVTSVVDLSDEGDVASDSAPQAEAPAPGLAEDGEKMAEFGQNAHVDVAAELGRVVEAAELGSVVAQPVLAVDAAPAPALADPVAAAMSPVVDESAPAPVVVAEQAAHADDDAADVDSISSAAFEFTALPAAQVEGLVVGDAVSQVAPAATAASHSSEQRTSPTGSTSSTDSTGVRRSARLAAKKQARGLASV